MSPAARSRPVRWIASLVGVCLGALLVAGCATTKENPSMPTQPTPQQALDTLRAQVHALTAAAGDTTRVSGYREELHPCGSPGSPPRQSAYVHVRFQAEPGKLAALRSGHLATRAGQGWRVRDDNTPDEGGWGLLDDANGYAIALTWKLDTLLASIVSSGPCLPTSAGTPTTQAWSPTT